MYNLLTCFREDQIAGLQISGDAVQGQNVLRVGVEYRPYDVSEEDGKIGADHKEMVLEYYCDDMRKILSRHKGSCVRQEAERVKSYSFIWK